VTDRFLALDAGNSKTVAVVVDTAGTVLGRGRGGRGDIYNAPSPDEAVAAVIGSARAALDTAGVEAADLVASAFRIAGVDWPEDARWWQQRLAAELPGIGRHSIANDGFATLRLGALDGVGVAVTVGTGPALAARSRDGREACSGWWVFDNLGGWGLAEGAIRSVCLAWMGLGEKTALTGRLLALFDVADPYELRYGFTRRFRERPPGEELRATRTVLEVAGTGDPVALALVEDQARAFARYAGWVSGEVGAVPSPEFPLVLNGSIVTSEYPVFRTMLTAALTARFPECPITVATAPPLAGCVLDALAEGGVALTTELRDRVAGAAHPSDFLGT